MIMCIDICIHTHEHIVQNYSYSVSGTRSGIVCSYTYISILLNCYSNDSCRKANRLESAKGCLYTSPYTTYTTYNILPYE
jgi:hypothetical protein